MSGVDGGVGEGGRLGVRVRDGDPAEGATAHHVWLFLEGNVGVPERVRSVGIAVGPTVRGDGEDVFRGVESSAPENAPELAASLELDRLERSREELSSNPGSRSSAIPSKPGR